MVNGSIFERLLYVCLKKGAIFVDVRELFCKQADVLLALHEFY